MNKKNVLDKIKVGYDEWEVREHEFGGYEYVHYPFSIAVDLVQRIIIRYNEKKNV